MDSVKFLYLHPAFRKHPVRGNGQSPPASFTNTYFQLNFLPLCGYGQIKRRKVMSTVSRGLPAQPHLDVPKQQARELLRQCQAASTDALDRIRRQHPRFHTADNPAISTQLKLSDAQLVI